jgi:hypothetical protein
MAINIPVVTKYDPSGLKKANKGLGDFAGGLKKLIGPAVLAAGFAALTSGITDSVKAASEDLKSQRLLARQLKTTTKASANQIKSVEKFIDKTSMATGVVDDELRPAFSNLVRGTGSVEKAQKLMTVALDGAAASGKPLNTVVQALIKAQNGQTMSLYRLAPELKKTKGGIDDYAASVKGAAAASASPFDRFNVAVENLSEKFGALLLPYIEQFVNYLTETVVPAVSEFFDDISNPNTDVGKAFKQMKIAIVGKDGKSGVYGGLLAVGQAVGNFFALFSSNGNALDGIVKAFELLALNLEAIGYNLASIINTPLTGFFDRIQKGFEFQQRGLDILNRPSLFGNAYSNVSPGQSGTSIRGIENFADGGIVMPRIGGTIARIGEAGQPEAVIPLSRLSEFTGGSGSNTYNISINSMGDSSSIGRAVVDAIKSFERTNGAGWRA